MKAVVWHKPKDVRVDEVEDPKIEHPRDAVIRVTSTAVCGSDLHIYNGLLPNLHKMQLGHEFMGVVEELGSEVTNLRVGDRVVVPFPIADGTCHFCQKGWVTMCESEVSNPNRGPKGGMLTQKGSGIYGYTDLYGGHAGGQAEKVRVPFADFGCRKVPAGVPDEKVLFLTDILPTGWMGTVWADVKPGDTVAVMGCGPVGIMAQKAARFKGARVIGVDPLDYRVEMAARTAGSEVLEAEGHDAVEELREMTGGYGPDVVIDAVGMEADRNILEKANALIHMQRGTLKVLRASFDAVRRGGRVSIMGVYGTPYDNFPVHQMFNKSILVRGGQAPVHTVIDELMDHLLQDRIVASDIITHTLPLDEAPYAYSIFNKKEEGCVKVVLKP